MTKITLDIKTCKDCPFFKEARIYTADSFEMPFNWFCTKAKATKSQDKDDPGRKIAGYVEWNNEDKVEVPSWCPIKEK